MNVRSRNELVSWILGFEDRAELLEPEDLRQRIIKTASDLLDIYRT